jgi:hypothetical protein
MFLPLGDGIKLPSLQSGSWLRIPGTLILFWAGTTSFARGGSQVAEKMSDDIDRASYSSRQEQKTDGQPKEAAETYKLALSS